MNDQSTLEERLQQYSEDFVWPRTPDLRPAIRRSLARERAPRSRLALRWVVLGLVVLFAALMAVPQVRAQVLEFLQIGVVRIFPVPLTATSTESSSLPQLPVTATPRAASTRAPEPAPAYIVSLRGIAGETTLEAARTELSFPILLPAYPADLGEPDRVFILSKGRLVILAWLDPNDPNMARLSLHEIGPGPLIVDKYSPRLLEQTEVNGNPAAWVTGPYLLQLTSGDVGWRRLVEGNTLVWEADGITYRLESNLSLEETLRIADSLK